MRQIHPEFVANVDPLALYPYDERPAPQDRPWVLINMVASADGACTVGGVSGGLGGPADAAVFRAVRASCDWILVAAGTARAERYGIPRPAADVLHARIASGRSPAARLAIVSASANLGPDLPLLADRRHPKDLPLVITGSALPSDRAGGPADDPPWHRAQGDSADHGEALRGRVELSRLPVDRPTPRLVLDELRRRGARTVLCEGGPSWNAQMVDSGLVDELCLTISPHLAGGNGPRIVSGSVLSKLTELRLTRLLEQDGVLCARYLTHRADVLR